MNEIALLARARGLAGHCLSRETLERLAEAEDLGAFARGLARLGGALDPIGEPIDVFAVERAVARTANRHLRMMYRWQERTPGALDAFEALQDRRSLRALLRGAAQGKPSHARLGGLFPTTSLPRLALAALAQQTSPADVVRQLVVLGHPDAVRLMPLVRAAHPDLLPIEVALLAGFTSRATRAAAAADDTVDDFVRTLIDAVNAQNAIVIAGEPRDAAAPADLFVHGGRWLSAPLFVSAARDSRQHAVVTLATALGHTPLAPLLPVVASDVASLDRTFLTTMLKRVTRAGRVDPLSYATVLRTLLLIDAQSRDLRTLVWGAVLGTPPALRRQRLVTPS